MPCFIVCIGVLSGELLKLPIKHYLIWLMFRSKVKFLLMCLPQLAEHTWCWDPWRYISCLISLWSEEDSGSWMLHLGLTEFCNWHKLSYQLLNFPLHHYCLWNFSPCVSWAESSWRMNSHGNFRGNHLIC